MSFLERAFSNVKLSLRVSRVVHLAVSKGQDIRTHLVECVSLADEYPAMVLGELLQYLSYSHAELSFGALMLLEHLVGSCNYNFHVALANNPTVQEKIVTLAIRRAEDEPHRKTQRLARLTILEYSRMFRDDKDLRPLSRLADAYERRTHKSLLRSLNVQQRKVGFKVIQPQDIVVYTPSDQATSSVGAGVKDIAPIKLSAAEVWPCHVCTYLNSPAASRCAACETVRHRHSPPNSPTILTAHVVTAPSTVPGSSSTEETEREKPNNSDDAATAPSANEEEIVTNSTEQCNGEARVKSELEDEELHMA